MPGQGTLIGAALQVSREPEHSKLQEGDAMQSLAACPLRLIIDTHMWGLQAAVPKRAKATTVTPAAQTQDAGVVLPKSCAQQPRAGAAPHAVAGPSGGRGGSNVMSPGAEVAGGASPPGMLAYYVCK